MEYNGYNRLARNYELLTDQYQLSMSNSYFYNNIHEKEVIFDIFFRKVPNNGSYAIMAGLDKIIPYIRSLKFNKESIKYLEQNGYQKEFIEYMKDFKFTGTITAIPDGTPVFPNEPLVTIKAPLIEAQIIETSLLSIVNGAMEHATGARNIVEAAPKGVKVLEFGARRADGQEAALDSSIYGIMAGCDATSNVLAANMLGLKPQGTQAHSFIESFDNELEAFIAYAKVYPDNCTLLVDTYNTLKSGIPNAIKTFKWMEDNNLPTNNIGIRIDSGDLAYLSKESRRMLREAGFSQTKIVLSNGLNAQTIEALKTQGAEFDILGVGDNISKPNGRMGCVYKEVALKEDKWTPKIKLSEDAFKIVNPGYKKVYRLFDKETGYAITDILELENKELPENEIKIISFKNNLDNKTLTNYEIVNLHIPIFINGKLVYDEPSMTEKIKYCNEQMNKLYPEIKRTTMPHEYYVDATEDYLNFKNDLIQKTRKRVNNAI